MLCYFSKKHLIPILLLLPFVLQGQKNVIKARIFLFPTVYSLGIGYERMINENKSIQFLYNKMGSIQTATDGPANLYSSFVPEFKFFFGKHSKTNINKSSFLGVFNEFTKQKTNPSGEIDRTKKHLTDRTRFHISPGILIGKNLQLSETWFIDVYCGFKYKFTSEESIYRENNQKAIENSQYQDYGIRIGLNFNYRIRKKPIANNSYR